MGRWAAGLAGGPRAWPMHPAVFLARKPGLEGLCRLEGTRAGPFVWSRALSTSPGSQRLLPPGLWERGGGSPSRWGSRGSEKVVTRCAGCLLGAGPLPHPGLSPSNWGHCLPVLQREAKVQ